MLYNICENEKNPYVASSFFRKSRLSEALVTSYMRFFQKKFDNHFIDMKGLTTKKNRTTRYKPYREKAQSLCGDSRNRL